MQQLVRKRFCFEIRIKNSSPAKNCPTYADICLISCTKANFPKCTNDKPVVCEKYP